MQFNEDNSITVNLDLGDAIIIGEAIKLYAEALMKQDSMESIMRLCILQRTCKKFIEYKDIIEKQAMQQEAILEALKREKETKSE